MEPRVPALWIAQERKTAPGSDEGILDRVLSLVRIPEDDAGEAEQPIARGRGQDLERLVVAASCRFDEIALHAPSVRRGPKALSTLHDGPAQATVQVIAATHGGEHRPRAARQASHGDGTRPVPRMARWANHSANGRGFRRCLAPRASHPSHVAGPDRPLARWASRSAAAVQSANDRRATTPALDALTAAGTPHQVVRTPRAGSAEESAELQGIPLGALLRTIVVRRGDDDYLFVLVPAGRRFDWPRLRAHLGVRRLTLPDAEEARAVTGYERYTITPFGSTRAWPVILDAAAADQPVLAIGGGAFGVNVHLAPADLVHALDAQVVEVSEPEA